MAANDQIISSKEAFMAAMSKFENCKNALQNAYLTMQSAVFTLDSTWNGDASEAFKSQFLKLSNNLKTSDGTIETAVNDIKMVVAGHEEVEAAVQALFDGLEDTTNPFAAG